MHASSQCTSVSIPLSPASRIASQVSRAAARRSRPMIMKIFRLVWPRGGQLADLGDRPSRDGSISTGWRTKSTMLSRSASAAVRLEQSTQALAGAREGDVADVVIPPRGGGPRAALEVVGPAESCPSASSTGERCTCMSTPPGRTSRPRASISRWPCMAPADLDDLAVADPDVGLGRRVRR